jgi:ASC-1-like (ASCH) protein
MPEDVKKLVADSVEAIKSGKKKVELDLAEPKSD